MPGYYHARSQHSALPTDTLAPLRLFQEIETRVARSSLPTRLTIGRRQSAGGWSIVVTRTGRAATTRRAPGVAPAPTVVWRVPASRRRAAAVPPVTAVATVIIAVPVISAIRVPVPTFPVRISVRITATIVVVAVVPEAGVGVTATATTVAHVLPRGRSVRTIRHGIVNANTAAVKFLFVVRKRSPSDRHQHVPLR